MLVSPFYISTDANPQTFRGRVLRLLPEYVEAVQGLSREFEALFVPTQDLFVEQLRHRTADALCPEPVHPYLSGHLVIAHGLLQALGW